MHRSVNRGVSRGVHGCQSRCECWRLPLRVGGQPGEQVVDVVVVHLEEGALQLGAAQIARHLTGQVGTSVDRGVDRGVKKLRHRQQLLERARHHAVVLAVAVVEVAEDILRAEHRVRLARARLPHRIRGRCHYAAATLS